MQATTTLDLATARRIAVQAAMLDRQLPPTEDSIVRVARHFDVIERQRPIANHLILFVALAGDDHEVAWLGCANRVLDRETPAFREEEKGVIGGAEAGAAASGKSAVAEMVKSKVGSTSRTAAEKTGAKSKDEAERKKVADRINGIYEATKRDTETILNGLDDKVSKSFSEGEAEARAAFEASQKSKTDAYFEKRY